MYSFVVYLYVSGSGSITSIGEESANVSAVDYLLLCGFCSEGFPFPYDGLRYFIVALPEPSIYYFSYFLVCFFASVPDLCIPFTPQKTFSFYSAMKEIS